MAIVVEDGTGLANANAYISQSDANTYLLTQGNPDEWGRASSSDRDTALQEAATWLDLRFRLRYLGQRTASTQGLFWPRAGVYDSEGYAVSSAAVPVAVKRASALAAAEYLVDPSALTVYGPSSTGGDGDILKVGSLTMDLSDSPADVMYRRVESMVAPYAFGTNEVLRG